MVNGELKIFHQRIRNATVEMTKNNVFTTKNHVFPKNLPQFLPQLEKYYFATLAQW